MIRRRDPAARGILEILLCYPGLHALWFHRIAHRLWAWRLPLLPRFLSHVSRLLTGIEIHPGAQLGRRVFIDHGMGVVIGETSVVGEECLIYQGVTLGGTSLKREKRHPTLEHHVVVGAGAKVIGNITIGHHSRVGSGSVVVKSAPPHSTIVGVPGHILEETGEERPGGEMEHNRLPDAVARAITALHEQVEALALQVSQLHALPVETVLPTRLSRSDVEQAFRAMSRSAEDPSADAQAFESGGGI